MTTQLIENENKNYSVKSFRIRYEAKMPPPTGDLIASPEKGVAMARGVFNELDGGPMVEHFGVAFLNSQNAMIGFKAINTGTVDQVAVYPRMIIHTALMVGASAIILFHNHPSGFVSPSEEDKRLTRTLNNACRIMDIRLLDHIIIGSNTFHSFTNNGEL